MRMKGPAYIQAYDLSLEKVELLPLCLTLYAGCAGLLYQHGIALVPSAPPMLLT